MLRDKVGVEAWRSVPNIPGVEASSQGQIYIEDHVICDKNGEKYIKGGIRKQFDNHGYRVVNVFCDGKWRLKKVHRLVAKAFIPNPNGLPEVNHINSDRTDNNVSNLEWVTSQENIAHREKFGKPAREFTKALRKPLFAGNLETFEVLRFESRREAERELGVANQDISKVIKGKKTQAGGYCFTEDENKATKDKLQDIKDNMLFLGGVIAVGLNEQEPLRFKSRAEAARQLKCGASNIGSVIAGRYKHSHGHWFCHADNQAVEKTREKFGSEVAEKVVKLMEV